MERTATPPLWAAGWNVIDFLVVVLGYMEFAADGNYSAIRSVRVLRPLRLISKIEALRVSAAQRSVRPCRAGHAPMGAACGPCRANGGWGCAHACTEAHCSRHAGCLALLGARGSCTQSASQ